jgi:hypothetical protein
VATPPPHHVEHRGKLLAGHFLAEQALHHGCWVHHAKVAALGLVEAVGKVAGEAEGKPGEAGVVQQAAGQGCPTTAPSCIRQALGAGADDRKRRRILLRRGRLTASCRAAWRRSA